MQVFYYTSKSTVTMNKCFLIKINVLLDRGREAGNNSALEWWLEDQITVALETLAVDICPRFSFHLVMNFYNAIIKVIIVVVNHKNNNCNIIPPKFYGQRRSRQMIACWYA